MTRSEPQGNAGDGGFHVPKYSKLEFERRWLVVPECLNSIQFQRERMITDKYIEGTGLRLRRMQAPCGDASYKLCRKYGKVSGVAEPIVNTYLSSAEYKLLDRLPGAVISKVRKEVAGGAIDVFGDRLAGLAIFEVEFESEAAALAYVSPDFVHTEITDDPMFSGANLAKPSL